MMIGAADILNAGLLIVDDQEVNVSRPMCGTAKALLLA